MTIEEVRAWFVGHGGGITAGEQLFYERVAGVLEPSETPELRVMINREGAIGSALLTDSRLIHIGTNLLKGMQISTVRRSDITGVDLGGLIFGKLTIKHPGGVMVLDGAKGLAKQLMAALGY